MAGHPKVTVYITNHNYGRFIRQAIESVLSQTLRDWELIVIDDGSTDGSEGILRSYESMRNVRLVFQKNKGLTVSSNIALRLSRGEYILRLDADDYLEENALLVLSHALDADPRLGLVYSDYYLVDEHGEITGIERRNKLGKEITLYDLPAHGACTMIRKACLLELGGYSEEIACQDGYDLWIRFIDRFGIRNVNIPLFYYRKHPRSLTQDKLKILQARRALKRRHVERLPKRDLRVVGIIPARGSAYGEPAYALRPLAGRPLIDYTIEAALGSGVFTQVAVVSEDPEILDHVGRFPGVLRIQRPPELARSNTSIVPTLKLALERLKSPRSPDAFMLLYINTPLRKEVHIRHAVDTMVIFRPDSVISVYEDLSTHYHHVGEGLKPLFRRRALRLEKEALWVENGAIYLARPRYLNAEGFLGERIGHIVMLKSESLQIDSEEDVPLVEQILQAKTLKPEAAAHVP